MTPLIIMLSVFVLYVGHVWIFHGVQKSISYSFYLLPDRWGWIFTVFCVGISLPAIYLASSNPEHLWIISFSAAGIIFAGAASHYEKKPGRYNPIQGRPVHMIGSYVGVLGSQLYMGLNGFWGFNIAFVVFALVLFKHKNFIWWLEVMAFGLLALYLSNGIL